MYSKINNGVLVDFNERDLDENGFYEIPNSVTSIGKWAFINCENIACVKIPESVTSIGDGAFSNCRNLTSVIIPNSVTSIGNEAFRYCKNLTSVVIGNNVTSIGDEAFKNCSEFLSVKIPDSLTDLKTFGFKNSTILQFKDKSMFYGLYKKADNQILDCDNSMAKKILKTNNLLDERITGYHLEEHLTLMYNLGIMSKKNETMTIKNDQGKEINMQIREVGFNILQKMFSKEVGFGLVHIMTMKGEVGDKLLLRYMDMHFHSMQVKGVNEEFLRFLYKKANLTEIIEQEKKQYGFITRVYDWFNERKDLTNLGKIEDESNLTVTPTSEANRYRIKRYEMVESGIDKIKWKVPTVELLIKEFAENKFINVTPKTKELAEFIGSDSKHEQKYFNKTVEIDKEKQLPDHILSEQSNPEVKARKPGQYEDNYGDDFERTL